MFTRLMMRCSTIGLSNNLFDFTCVGKVAFQEFQLLMLGYGVVEGVFLQLATCMQQYVFVWVFRVWVYFCVFCVCFVCVCVFVFVCLCLFVCVCTTSSKSGRQQGEKERGRGIECLEFFNHLALLSTELWTNFSIRCMLFFFVYILRLQCLERCTPMGCRNDGTFESMYDQGIAVANGN